MKRDAEAADLGLSLSGRNGPSRQVNTPAITTTTTDVCGSTSDPVKGGEKELGIQNDGEFNLEDEENLKRKGTLVPVINSSAGSKDSLQGETEDDTYISNDETTGHERDDNYFTKGDELKETDLGTENKRVPFWRKLIAYLPWKSKRSSSDLERKGIFNCGCDDCSDNCLDCYCCYCLASCCDRVVYFGDGEPYGEARMTKAQPNPGIRRPPVTIHQPPPPPPPPTL